MDAGVSFRLHTIKTTIFPTITTILSDTNVPLGDEQQRKEEEERQRQHQQNVVMQQLAVEAAERQRESLAQLQVRCRPGSPQGYSSAEGQLQFS